MSELTQERVRSLFSYDPETGDFIRKVVTANRVKVGDIAGAVNDRGYRQIMVDGVNMRAHRLVFLYMLGRMPCGHVDHINGITDDNSWRNLREVTNSENCKNAKKHGCSQNPMTGVVYRPERERYMAYITHEGKRINLGSFEDLFEAACARKSAQNKFGFHPNHGRAA